MTDDIFAPPPDEAPRLRPSTCRAQSPQGDRCSLYVGHYGPHRSRHLHDSWENPNPD